VEIDFSDGRMPGRAIVDLMIRAGEICISEEGLPSERVSVSVTFVSGEEIRELNRMYRSSDVLTDVLSFPQYEKINEIPKQGDILLGDVVICTEQALLQADEYGHSAERELVYLFVHGLYHLLCYRHKDEAERERMREHEEKVMEKLGLIRQEGWLAGEG
jgi:probable rRNA maturation factor